VGVLCGWNKLSEFDIDADKDWDAKGILNLKELALGMTKGDIFFRQGGVLIKISPGPIGHELTTHGPGQPIDWEPPPGKTVPTVVTDDATDITPTTAVLNGRMTWNGREDADHVYFDWDTDSGEPYANTEDLGPGGEGSYEKELTGLTHGTPHYFRIRAHNSKGESKGAEKTFTTETIVAPTMATHDADEIAATAAKLHGEVTDTGLENPTRYLDWGTKSASEFVNQSFFPIPPVDVTPGVTGSWQDVVSPYIPAWATGAILYVYTSGGSGADADFGLRKKGSTDTKLLVVWDLDFHEWAMIGVNAERIFQCYVGNAYIKVYLTGYTSTGVTFFDNAIQCDPGTGAWENVDISAHVPADTIGGIFMVEGDVMGAELGLRPPSSTEDRRAECKRTFLGITGCSGQEFGAYRENASIHFYLIGYITDGVVFFDTEKDYSLTDIAVWKDIDCSGDAPGAAMLLFDVRLIGVGALLFGLRKDATAVEQYLIGRWRQAVIACSGAQVAQGKIQSTDVDFYLVGYATLQEGYDNEEDCGVGGVGLYEKAISGLTPETTYYFRARGVNSGGTGVGIEKEFTTLAS